MMKRGKGMKFMPNLFAFPGGRVDQADATAAAAATCTRLKGLPLAAERVAAIRELQEEMGLLVARDGAVVSQPAGGDATEGAAAPVPFARWCTPASEPRRFDTWFFAHAVDSDIAASVPLTLQPGEVAAAEWVAPDAALEMHADPKASFKLSPPTYIILHQLATAFGTAAAVVDRANALYPNGDVSTMPLVQPVLRVDSDFNTHIKSGVTHLADGVHEFPYGMPNPHGGSGDVLNKLRVHVGSPLAN
jgi:8-oxo-dGTP pyrophosphatase MutT (NUDIX family)